VSAPSMMRASVDPTDPDDFSRSSKDPALMAEQTKGKADKQMADGTWVHVSGHGNGKCVGYKAYWTGFNDHIGVSLGPCCPRVRHRLCVCVCLRPPRD
jgi:hypothetical protein